ncbi:hypothetical protein ACLKA7_006282 [Drosophila subpalustris]
MENSNIRDFGNTNDDTIDTISNETSTSRTLKAKNAQTDVIAPNGTAAKLPEQQQQKQQLQKIDEQIEGKDQQKTEGGGGPEAAVAVPVASPAGNDHNNNVNGQETQELPPKQNRCDKCGKKFGLTGGFPCRCGGTYCAFHRYSDRHDCNFDYRKMGATQIRRDNPLVVPEKLRKL